MDNYRRSRTLQRWEAFLRSSSSKVKVEAKVRVVRSSKSQVLSFDSETTNQVLRTRNWPLAP